jgi:adenylate cyclase, class 2
MLYPAELRAQHYYRMAEYHNRCYDDCMATGTLHKENEIKVPVSDVAALEERLRSLGFQILHPRVFESNVIYDTPEGSLRARGELLRIRQAGERVFTFAYKGPATVKRHKEREELELAVSNPEVLETILHRLGYVPRFRYEKFRTEWAVPGQDGVLMVDETPVGTYMELEGPSNWIDEIAGRLGYRDADYVNLSYARLYEADCIRRGVVPSDMVFPGDGTDSLVRT